MIDTKKHQARILALTIAMAAFGCGDGGGGIIKLSVLGQLHIGANGEITANGGNGGTILPRNPFEDGPWYVPVDAP